MDPITDGAISVDSLAAQIAEGLGEDLDYEREPEVVDDEQDGTSEDGQDGQDPVDDQDDGDEDGEGDGDEGDEDGDDDSAPNASIDDETLVDIKIGNDEYEVNFAELRAGYLRNEDFMQRAQALEAEHQTKVDALEQAREDLLEELLAASTIVKSDTSKYDQVNWEALKKTDPDQYSKLRVEALEAKEAAGALEARRNNVAAIQKKAQELRYKAYAEQQLTMASKLIPEFEKDETKSDLAKYAREIGYTDEEIYGIVDARHLLLLHSALQHSKSAVRRKEAAEKKVTKDLPPVNKPGAKAPQNHADRAASKDKLARFNKDRSVASAAALLAASFD